MIVTAEFTVEPFVPGDPGPHVRAAIDAAAATGAVIDVGPFCTSVRGADTETILRAIDGALRAALEHGATHMAVQIFSSPAL